MGKVWDVLAPRNLELGPLAGSASGQGNWRNWRLARDDNGIAWLVLDKPGSSANVLSEDVLIELDDVLATLERDLPKGVILRSGKPGGFIAGADIHEFSGMTDVAAVETRLTHGNAIVDRLDHLAVPTVAVIHGYCLGGGLEIALACDFRIAQRDAQLGFPEVNLGLLPGGGGTQRAPRLISPGRARWLTMSGERISAETAGAWGLVEFVVDDLEAGIARYVEPLDRQSPHAIRQIKSLLRDTRDERDDEREVKAFAACLGSEDGQEGVAAFLEKRQANWTGR